MKILAVDYGDVRTGLAVCDITETLASPLLVISERNADRLAEKITAVITGQGIEAVIIGNPINMNGTAGQRSKKCADFAEKLSQSINVPVSLWDERQTTITAAGIMNENNRRGKKRKETIDAVAAAVLLENYLMYRRNNK